MLEFLRILFLTPLVDKLFQVVFCRDVVVANIFPCSVVIVDSASSIPSEEFEAVTLGKARFMGKSAVGSAGCSIPERLMAHTSF